MRLTPPETFFDLSTEDRSGLPPVMVLGHIRAADSRRTILIRLPAATDARIKSAVAGPHGPAIVGLVEFALDELDRQRKTLIIADPANTTSDCSQNEQTY